MSNLPTTMAAIVLTGHGDLDKLVYRKDFPVPTPASGEVLIQVTACGLNNTDVLVRQGAYGTDEDPDDVASVEPNLNALQTLDLPTIGVTVAGGDSDYVLRFLPPLTASRKIRSRE